MKSKVFGADMRTSFKQNMLQKLDQLVDSLEMAKTLKPRDLTAIKLHFGERGNTAFIRPIYIKRIVDKVTQCQAAPFITDANTLYVGTRSNSAQHLRTALENGFAPSVVGAPLIIADGLRGNSAIGVEINQKNVKIAYVGAEVVEADALISAAHFKLHEVAGFGGAIKNVGMGSASRRGKLDQHSGLGPKVQAKKCIGCGDCQARCSQKAITLQEQPNAKTLKAFINPEKCIGCADCILACPQGAIQVQWSASIPTFMEKMVEYTAAALKGKEGKSFFINFLTQISPGCDCLPFADAPIVRDIGILASTDIVALDQASADLVNQEPALPGACLKTATGPGEDKIRGVYPNIDWEKQLEYAESLGLGSRDYELEWLPAK
ncbi:MAG: DUF362 domain-containing protein [Pseudomonadota bacterium]